MHRFGRRLSVILGLTLALSVLTPRAGFAWTGYEAGELWMVNRWDRAPRGVGGLAMQNFLVWRARQHSYDMMRAGRLYHSNLAATPGAWLALGENVGVGPSLPAINTAFMNSSEHRSNILCRCFRWAGMGVVRDSRGYYWVTQLYWG